MTGALALAALLLAGPIDWVVWAKGHDFEASLAPQGDPTKASIQVEGCGEPKGCPTLTVNVQASRPARPGSICAWATLPVQGIVVFADGFESGDTSQWGHAPPDGVVRLLIPWSGCAGQIVRILSEVTPRSELVLLDADCRGSSVLEHGGEMTVVLEGRTWAARISTGRLKLGTLKER